jgi:hypothetical protein
VGLRLIAVRPLQFLFQGFAFAAERQPRALQFGLVSSESGQRLVFGRELVREGGVCNCGLFLPHALLIGKVSQVGAVVGEDGPFNVS